MTGTPILVRAVVLFVVSLLLEHILVYRAARRKRRAVAARAASARPDSAAPTPIGQGGLLAPGQAAGYTQQAEAGTQTSSTPPDIRE